MTDPTQEKNPGARERILRVAEDSFFSAGYDDVSVRALTEAADVNVAAVNYHFGGKRKLFLEVLQRRFATMAERNCQRLQKAIGSRRVPDPRCLVESYVNLLMGDEQTMEDSRNFLNLVSRELADDNDALQVLLQELIMPTHTLMKNELARLLPRVDPVRLSLCVSSITGQVFHFIRCPEVMLALAGCDDQQSWLEQVRAHIVNFSLKGIAEETSCTISS